METTIPNFDKSENTGKLAADFHIVQETESISEFKLYASLNDPKFLMEDDLGNKIDIIGIRVAENKYSFKITNPKTGNYFLKIAQSNITITKSIEIK